MRILLKAFMCICIYRPIYIFFSFLFNVIGHCNMGMTISHRLIPCTLFIVIAVRLSSLFPTDRSIWCYADFRDCTIVIILLPRIGFHCGPFQALLQPLVSCVCVLLYRRLALVELGLLYHRFVHTSECFHRMVSTQSPQPSL